MKTTKFALGKQNYMIMGVAGALVLLGFLLMMGSSSTMETYNPSIFDTRRIVFGPNLCFIGYVLMVVGILWRGKETTKTDVSAPVESDEQANA